MLQESLPPATKEERIFTPERTSKEAEKPLFSYDEELSTVSSLGVFVCKNSGTRKPIEITPKNKVFFANIKRMDYPRVIYQGSGVVVGLLAGEHELSKQSETCRPVAFFDTDGNFHDNRFLKNIFEYVKKNGQETLRHRAVFEYEDKNQQLQQENIAIDDIYCLAAAASE